MLAISLTFCDADDLLCCKLNGTVFMGPFGSQNLNYAPVEEGTNPRDSRQEKQSFASHRSVFSTLAIISLFLRYCLAIMGRGPVSSSRGGSPQGCRLQSALQTR